MLPLNRKNCMDKKEKMENVVELKEMLGNYLSIPGNWQIRRKIAGEVQKNTWAQYLETSSLRKSVLGFGLCTKHLQLSDVHVSTVDCLRKERKRNWKGFFSWIRLQECQTNVFPDVVQMQPNGMWAVRQCQVTFLKSPGTPNTSPKHQPLMFYLFFLILSYTLILSNQKHLWDIWLCGRLHKLPEADLPVNQQEKSFTASFSSLQYCEYWILHSSMPMKISLQLRRNNL